MADTGIATESADLAAPDGTADAYVAYPSTGGPHPAVLLYMDAYGIRAALEAHARRLASAGYFVLAPNAFYRDGPSPLIPNIEEQLRSGDRSALMAVIGPRMKRLTPDAVTADAAAWLAYLRSRPEARQGPIGAVGYCMGGRQSLRMAGEFPDEVAAAASFHGGQLATEADDSPHLAAVKATGELYIGHADNDGSMDPAQMARLTQALAEAHVRHTAELYVGSLHGWTQTDTPVYDAPATERHWHRLTDLLDRTLKG